MRHSAIFSILVPPALMPQLAPSSVFFIPLLFVSVCSLVFSRSLLNISCILICAFIPFFTKISLYLAVLGFIALQALSLVQRVGAARTEACGLLTAVAPCGAQAPGAWSR